MDFQLWLNFSASMIYIWQRKIFERQWRFFLSDPFGQFAKYSLPGTQEKKFEILFFNKTSSKYFLDT